MSIARNPAHQKSVSRFRFHHLCCCAGSVFTLASSAAWAQFTDACDNAPSVGNGTYSFNLTSATSGATLIEPSCADDRRPFIDQWIRYVATATGPIAITTVGLTTGDTVLSVHGNDCFFPEYDVRACNDNTGSTLQSRIQMSLTDGDIVLIRVAGALETRPTGSVSIQPIAVLPIGDTCADPAPAVLGTNTYDVSRSGEDGYGCRGFRDEWFTFTPATDGGLTVSTCGQRSDPGITILDGCAGNTLACSGYEQCSAGLGVIGGMPLLIRLANPDAVGPEQFTITLDPSGIPSNDLCTSPIPVSLGNTSFDNTFATTQVTGTCTPGPFAFTSGLDLWYAFSPAITGIYDISTEESTGISDTSLSIFESCNGSPIACNDDARGFRSFIRTNLSSDQTYLIQVSGAGLPFAGTPVDRGSGVLTIRRSIPPANDDCTNALSVPAGVSSYNMYDASTGEQVPSCLASINITRNDVWFKYTPTTTGPVEISLLPGGAAASLSYFSSCTSNVSTTSADTVFDSNTGVDSFRLVLNGQANVPLRFRVAYRLFLSDVFQPPGTGDFYVGPVTAPVPVNDLCEQRLPIFEGTTAINLANAGTDCRSSTSPQFDSCGAIADDDIFYDFSTPNAGIITININDGVSYPQYDGLIVSVYNTCAGAPIACSLAYGDAPVDGIQFDAAAGQHYIVRVATVARFGTGIQTGSITLGRPGACDSIDFNNDGIFPDDTDVADFLSVYGGGSCSNGTNCHDIDFNNDGIFPDDSDISAFLNVYGGGSC